MSDLLVDGEVSDLLVDGEVSDLLMDGEVSSGANTAFSQRLKYDRSINSFQPCSTILFTAVDARKTQLGCVLESFLREYLLHMILLLVFSFISTGFCLLWHRN